MKNRKLAVASAAILLPAFIFASCGEKKPEQSFKEVVETVTKIVPVTEIGTRRVAHISPDGEISTYYEETFVEKTSVAVETKIVTVPVPAAENSVEQKTSGGEQKNNGSPAAEKTEKNKSGASAKKETAGSTRVSGGAAQQKTGTVPSGSAGFVTSVSSGSGAPALLSISSPVPRGSYCSVIIMGKPNTTYTLTSDAAEGKLESKSDASGIASWNFPVKADNSGEKTVTVSEGKNSLKVSFFAD